MVKRQISKKVSKKKLKARLPLEAALKLRNHPVASKKGKKGYDRTRLKKQNRKILQDWWKYDIE
ncbi:MAG: hypothetical protein HXY53_00935 [Nitrospirae bacterium]|nr:hypothetical protein [Nitrospirota bacterium]